MQRFSASPATSEQWGKMPFVAQTYILLICQSNISPPERQTFSGGMQAWVARRVGAACIRHVNDPTGVWGLWKIAPN